MSRLCAIDVGSQAVRFVVIERSLRRSEIVAASTVQRQPDEDDAAFLGRVRETLAQPLGSVAITISGRHVSPRLLEFPFRDVKKIEAAVGFELDGQVPYDLDDIATTWEVVGKPGDRTRVLAAVTPRERLQKTLALWRDAGMEPRAVAPPATAIAELVRGTQETVAIASIGASETHVAVVRGGIVFARTLQVGSGSVDRALATHFGLELAQARAAKESELRLAPVADGTVHPAQEVAQRGVEAIETALLATFRSLPAELMPARLVLTGGGSRLAGLDGFLGRRLALPVTLLDLGALTQGMQPLGETLAVAPEYAVALGLVLTCMRSAQAVPLNFRRGAFAYAGDLQVYRGSLVRLGAAVAIVTTLAIVGAGARYLMVKAVEKEMDQGFCAATQKIVGKAICDPTAALATLRQSPGAESGLVIPTYSSARLLDMLSRAVGSDIDVSFEHLEFRIDASGKDVDRISGKGEAATFETTEQLVQALKRDPCVTKAEVSKQRRKSNDARVEFNLDAEVKCPAGRLPAQELAAVADTWLPQPTALGAMPTPAGVEPGPELLPPGPGMGEPESPDALPIADRVPRLPDGGPERLRGPATLPPDRRQGGAPHRVLPPGVGKLPPGIPDRIRRGKLKQAKPQEGE